uniref:Uncharacterized protein n=1 Tax=Anguilla anguilla TaxID=7936 RepID=A0A0E9R7G3_ANGAN
MIGSDSLLTRVLSSHQGFGLTLLSAGIPISARIC